MPDPTARRAFAFSDRRPGRAARSRVISISSPDSSLLDIVAIKQDAEELLGCGVDVVTEGGLSPYLRDDVLAEAREL